MFSTAACLVNRRHGFSLIVHAKYVLTDGLTDGQPEYIMLSAYYCWPRNVCTYLATLYFSVCVRVYL